MRRGLCVCPGGPEMWGGCGGVSMNLGVAENFLWQVVRVLRADRKGTTGAFLHGSGGVTRYRGWSWRKPKRISYVGESALGLPMTQTLLCVWHSSPPPPPRLSWPQPPFLAKRVHATGQPLRGDSGRTPGPQYHRPLYRSQDCPHHIAYLIAGFRLATH